jgi:hypothetical protein
MQSLFCNELITIKRYSLEELIDRIKEIKENVAVRLAPNLLMWKEGSSYNIDITNRQFDDLQDLMKSQKGKVFYLIDLSLAGRPDPEMIQLVEERLKNLKDQFEHVAVYTGKNYLMHLGIKFFFIRFDFPSYSAHGSLKSALNSFS